MSLLLSHCRCWAHVPGVIGCEEVTAGRPCALLPRSRTKNMMWYGVLGTRELLHRTYKNLEQKVLLDHKDYKVRQALLEQKDFRVLLVRQVDKV